MAVYMFAVNMNTTTMCGMETMGFRRACVVVPSFK